MRMSLALVIIVETIPFNLPVASMVFNPITLATSVIPQPLGMQGPLNCINFTV